MEQIDIKSYLENMKKIGGVIFFIDNENIMKIQGLTNPNGWETHFIIGQQF